VSSRCAHRACGRQPCASFIPSIPLNHIFPFQRTVARFALVVPSGWVSASCLHGADVELFIVWLTSQYTTKPVMTGWLLSPQRTFVIPAADAAFALALLRPLTLHCSWSCALVLACILASIHMNQPGTLHFKACPRSHAALTSCCERIETMYQTFTSEWAVP
jgi:hypothetical protein